MEGGDPVDREGKDRIQSRRFKEAQWEVIEMRTKEDRVEEIKSVII